jgi:hypothetical protein
MMTTLVNGQGTATRGSVEAASKGQPVITRHCDGCGAAVRVSMEAEALPMRWGDVWWCGRCLRTLSRADIDRLTRELPLRGVPLN